MRWHLLLVRLQLADLFLLYRAVVWQSVHGLESGEALGELLLFGVAEKVARRALSVVERLQLNLLGLRRGHARRLLKHVLILIGGVDRAVGEAVRFRLHPGT